MSNPSAVAFVRSLAEIGRVSVPPDEAMPADLAQAVDELDVAARGEMAFDPPELNRESAAWALGLIYRACQALVFREIDAASVERALDAPCPQRPSASVCYSADLSLRYLPDLLSLARGIAPDDPLVAGLTALARAWPLSSVGTAGLEDVDVSAFVDHPSLRQLYVDRIIERGDVSRLKHPALRAAVGEALGAYPDLAPRIAAAL